MKTLAALTLAMLPFVVSCKSISVDPETANAAIQQISATTVNFGLMALSKDAATWATVVKYSSDAKKIIDSVVVPFFSGIPLDQLTVAAADQTLLKLNDKVNPLIMGIVQSAINGAMHLLQFPQNPTDKLSADQRGMILALFNGISSGISQFLKWGGPTAKAAPAANKLSWK
jgi:hypothetical protein